MSNLIDLGIMGVNGPELNTAAPMRMSPSVGLLLGNADDKGKSRSSRNSDGSHKSNRSRVSTRSTLPSTRFTGFSGASSLDENSVTTSKKSGGKASAPGKSGVAIAQMRLMEFRALMSAGKVFFSYWAFASLRFFTPIGKDKIGPHWILMHKNVIIAINASIPPENLRIRLSPQIPNIFRDMMQEVNQLRNMYRGLARKLQGETRGIHAGESAPVIKAMPILALRKHMKHCHTNIPNEQGIGGRFNDPDALKLLKEFNCGYTNSPRVRYPHLFHPCFTYDDLAVSHIMRLIPLDEWVTGKYIACSNRTYKKKHFPEYLAAIVAESQLSTSGIDQMLLDLWDEAHLLIPTEKMETSTRSPPTHSPDYRPPQATSSSANAIASSSKLQA
ncbi:hypothetical protein GALMADRAFT_145967 [Galerina marginata CBS 339.88]|uniref:Uncharacterized protein n=1 Tax=Galerina marginata (strain CBS 339.88) TaxID=685588 RepID=A0A067SDH1_GALM3|nr:hypothetical protein GALMADRAFT_145967 [Galerina marginata CBS 339.88]